jgi:uncharacterized membrane protein
MTHDEPAPPANRICPAPVTRRRALAPTAPSHPEGASIRKHMADSTVQSIEIDATPGECFSVAADVASYPEWATGVRVTEVLEEDEQGRPARARFVIDGMVKEISYTLVYEYDEPRTIGWTAEPGADLKAMDGSYAFNSIGEKRTEVVYALRASPAFTIPGFLRRQVEKQIVTTALRGLRTRVEQLSS